MIMSDIYTELIQRDINLAVRKSICVARLFYFNCVVIYFYIDKHILKLLYAECLRRKVAT